MSTRMLLLVCMICFVICAESSVISILTPEGNQFKLDKNAINSVMDKVGERPVAIYTIYGPKRSGKSFLLNFLLKYLTFSPVGDGSWIDKELAGFAFRGGSERHTIGMDL